MPPSSCSLPRVSVVIPTNGLRDWTSAVDSALRQDGVVVEVILVNNGSAAIPHSSRYPTLRILESPPYRGANGARQLGIQSASYDLIALLDDDDAWMPNKLGEQLKYVVSVIGDADKEAWVCGAGALIIEPSKPAKKSPRDFATLVPDVADYLFKRSSLTASLNQLQSSTLVFPKWLAIEVPFQADLKIHQDWTWLLAVEDALNARVIVCPKYLIHYNKGSGASITRNTKSIQSMNWAQSHLAMKTSRIRGDFFLTVPFNMALEARSAADAIGVLVHALTTARPGVSAVVRSLLALARLVAQEAARLVTSRTGRDL